MKILGLFVLLILHCKYFKLFYLDLIISMIFESELLKFPILWNLVLNPFSLVFNKWSWFLLLWSLLFFMLTN